MRKLQYATLAFCVTCAGACSTASEAQTAGTYSGSSADGQSVSFTVGTDGGGHLAVTAGNIYFSAPCKGGTIRTLDSAWGLGTDTVITGHRAHLIDSDPYFYFDVTFNFTGSQVIGNITTRVPDLDPGHTPPTRADFCESPKQSWSATLSAGPAHVPAPGTVIHLQAAH